MALFDAMLLVGRTNPLPQSRFSGIESTMQQLTPLQLEVDMVSGNVTRQHRIVAASSPPAFYRWRNSDIFVQNVLVL